MAEISDLISALQKSGLDAECPECGETSALSSWTLFDGTKPFPTDAEQKVIIESNVKTRLFLDWS